MQLKANEMKNLYFQKIGFSKNNIFKNWMQKHPVWNWQNQSECIGAFEDLKSKEKIMTLQF